MGIKFGYEDTSIDGTFTSGGAEANLTAVLCALNKAFPEYAHKGLRVVDKDPVIYVSAESHHSLIKAARVAGLGMNAVRSIAVDHSLQMQPEALRKQIDADIKENRFPLMVVATMGTTGTGAYPLYVSERSTLKKILMLPCSSVKKSLIPEMHGCRCTVSMG